MKILLIGNYENDALNSMQRFADFMSRALTQAGHQVRGLRPPAVIGRLRRSGHGVGKWLGYGDKFGIFPFTLRPAIQWADVVHICDHANSFYTKYLGSRAHVVTCHDLLAVRSALGEIPQNPTSWTGRQLQRLILNGLNRAQHVACVSDATRADLLRIGRVPADRISRVYNCLNYNYARMERREAVPRIGGLGVDANQSFLLHVGGNQWYKNRLGVLRIFRILNNHPKDLRLVMVGKPWTPEMRRFVSEHGMGDRIVELNGVADPEDLRALYSTATMLLFPSFQEGFGWPILEAQACGCPVVTSDRAPMNEVGGEAAIYVDPENPESAAAIVRRALMNVSTLGGPSLQNAARFSESATIDSYLSIYERVQRDTYVSSLGLVETVQ